ncbi:hypothetical protein ES703_59727 [subsurface metagenome]
MVTAVRSAGPQQPSGGRRALPLDCVANRSEGDAAHLDKRCPGYFLVGQCECGNRYAKELYCGREWCAVCGQEWSAAHQRRFARWLPKVMQMQGVGYLVFTIPLELRGRYRKRVRREVKVKGELKVRWVHPLADLGHAVQEMLKAQGFSRGLRRWHFFGDESTTFHPHLNVLVDGGHIRKAQLRALKREYAALLGVDPVRLASKNPWYGYRESPAEMVFTLEYGTRATFTDWRWDVGLALELYRFRNQVWWGSRRWDGEACWSMDAVEAGQDLNALAVASLESGVCPKCGKPVEWSRALRIEVLETLESRPLGAGYYELESIEELGARAPPGLSLEEVARLEMVRLSRLQDLARARDKYLVDLQEEAACDLAYLDALERGEL